MVYDNKILFPFLFFTGKSNEGVKIHINDNDVSQRSESKTF